MLILDKWKAVERVMALTTCSKAVEPAPPPARARRRTEQGIAAYERRPGPPETVALAALEPKASRRRRRVALAVEPLPA
ncbi:MAG: hypothetical protein M3P30_06805 [Chloroflexota bacterium]|nr:hypothetical protein [Chloroflexota bacterium]